ncbi:hypothetical protein ACFFK0_14905 [Paenibacillus chartarius]|uniref:4Fe4S-binding SPASM domain-containing protein n=1 Tax=Paenibacillus chartarius TaxID=747481 RepID=A0ABV6DMA8_9BACL
MPMIRHDNYRNESGEVYCCLRNRVVVLGQEQQDSFCQGCPMFAGHLGGNGISCEWDDIGDVANPHKVVDPQKEFRRNQLKHIPVFPDGTVTALQRCS